MKKERRERKTILQKHMKPKPRKELCDKHQKAHSCNGFRSARPNVRPIWAHDTSVRKAGGIPDSCNYRADYASSQVYIPVFHKKKKVYIPVVVVLYTTYFVEVVVRFRETSTASTPLRAGAQ